MAMMFYFTTIGAIALNRSGHEGKEILKEGRLKPISGQSRSDGEITRYQGKARSMVADRTRLWFLTSYRNYRKRI
ncbi:hypothetical protein PMG71_09380 [Roseofilum sp. BLCC_M154]|uniref:Uncharacterized protein n=1 Tax=Roseofilum acuticapitatum BLCC-M154 TaxID=3022444 RepID=A0ABT7ARV9_9CYAN|nr:hypothetical protein [Roseofilum acuticapitatum]MDJ1169636.1 hypothetical protein [Roseofilum acuticapitatum BLCC-M154]